MTQPIVATRRTHQGAGSRGLKPTATFMGSLGDCSHRETDLSSISRKKPDSSTARLTNVSGFFITNGEPTITLSTPRRMPPKSEKTLEKSASAEKSSPESTRL